MPETVCLPPKLDLPAAGPLTTELLKHLDGDLTLDAAQVTQIGALCTQVIGSAAISLAAAGHRLTITNMPDRVVEQLQHLGFTPESLTEVRS
ncbi:STAS domain-containing protein [Pseudooceanicola sp.]|uniref:STAS domain-containing protein n=1 Tax=Pseudooceanicola sp. TaxID=1914328 RepID=UPI0035C77ACE